MTRDQHAAHATLVNEILLYLGQRDDMLVARRVVGTFRRIECDPTVYRIGTPGEPDIQGTWLRLLRIPYSYGYVEPKWFGVGQAFAVEVKTGSGRLSIKQRNWRDKFVSVGGLHVEARTMEDVYKVWPQRSFDRRVTEGAA